MLFTTHIYAQGIELNGTISAQGNQIKNVAESNHSIYQEGLILNF